MPAAGVNGICGAGERREVVRKQGAQAAGTTPQTSPPAPIATSPPAAACKGFGGTRAVGTLRCRFRPPGLSGPQPTTIQDRAHLGPPAACLPPPQSRTLALAPFCIPVDIIRCYQRVNRPDGLLLSASCPPLPPAACGTACPDVARRLPAFTTAPSLLRALPVRPPPNNPQTSTPTPTATPPACRPCALPAHAVLQPVWQVRERVRPHVPVRLQRRWILLPRFDPVHRR